jgi:hypothetical protein
VPERPRSCNSFCHPACNEHCQWDRNATEAATVACRAWFGAVAEQLQWEIDYAEPGADRERAINLRTPLEKLVARYPAPQPTAVPVPAVPAVPGGGSPPGGGGP